jgi:hypothetical protein
VSQSFTAVSAALPLQSSLDLSFFVTGCKRVSVDKLSMINDFVEPILPSKKHRHGKQDFFILKITYNIKYLDRCIAFGRGRVAVTCPERRWSMLEFYEQYQNGGRGEDHHRVILRSIMIISLKKVEMSRCSMISTIHTDTLGSAEQRKVILDIAVV